MLTVVAAGKAAPGASTSTWALARSWPRPVLVVDADPAGGDLAAALPGQVETGRGILSWSAAARSVDAAALAADVPGHVVDVGPAVGADVWLMPGCANAAQGATLTPAVWTRLAEALAQVGERLGRDVLVDSGRLTDGRGCFPVAATADLVLVVTRCTLRSAHAAREATARLREESGSLANVRALAITHGPYPAGEIAAALGLRLGGTLPYDPSAAAAFSDGVRTRGRGRTTLSAAAAQLAQAWCGRGPAVNTDQATPEHTILDLDADTASQTHAQIGASAGSEAVIPA